MAARLAILAAAFACAAAHRIAAVECAAEDAECVLASTTSHTPAWVAAFSTAGVGPEQFWINFGATPDVVAVRWVNFDAAATPTAAWGLAPGSHPTVVSGLKEQYVYGKYHSPWIMTVNFTGLPLNTKIYYVVGDSATGVSAEYSFTSSPGVGPIYPYTTAFVADIGEADSANDTVTHLLETQDDFDSLIINGDISYATGCEENNCTTWDAFCRMASPLAAIKPWGLSIGNHELADYANGIAAISSTYRFRGQPTAGNIDEGTGLQYFSWNVGPIHYISVNSFYEIYSAGTRLHDWLVKDIAGIDYTATPWVLVTLHAPWYNSNKAHQGEGEPARKGLEQIFVAAGASAVFSGHVHAYERSYPVNNFTVVAPGVGGMTHLNIGDAGAGLYTTWEALPAWSAFRNATWGHGKFTVMNATHALWRWFQNDQPAHFVSDSVYVLNANPRVW